LLAKAMIGGGLAQNCDSDVSKPRYTWYVKYHWTDEECSNVLAPAT